MNIILDLIPALADTLIMPAIGVVISAYVGRRVANKVTESELRRAEERVARAESLYQLAIAYLRTVAAWCAANGIADRLPDPPRELEVDL